MDKEDKIKWTAALRSGQYKQGKGALKSAEGAYCCLGVLAEIKGCEWKDSSIKWRRAPYFNNEPVGDATRRLDYLSVKFSGLDTDVQIKLAEMNDVGKSFDEIADYIEHNL